MNATQKEEKIGWLKAETPEDTCRILSNVRCLSEGVDVPALDAVLFLTPRNSQIDVVQSVGRVMRNAPGKKRGYIVLPVVIPAGARKAAKGGNAIGAPGSGTPVPEQREIEFEIGEIERAIYAKLVQKVGNRHHWEDWAKDIAKIARTHIDRIQGILENKSNTRE